MTAENAIFVQKNDDRIKSSATQLPQTGGLLFAAAG